MNWMQTPQADSNSKEMAHCSMCHKPVSGTMFCAEDFEELRCLLAERDSGLGAKLMDSDGSQSFCVCEDCKIKVDEDLKTDPVHIMYCE